MSLRTIATFCLPKNKDARPTEIDYQRFREGCRGLGINGTDAEIDKLARACLDTDTRNKRRRCLLKTN